MSLSDKIKFDEDHGQKIIIKEDVKEKIQNAQRRLKEILDSFFRSKSIGKKELIKEIDKIFKEEFGDKLIDAQVTGDAPK